MNSDSASIKYIKEVPNKKNAYENIIDPINYPNTKKKYVE